MTPIIKKELSRNKDVNLDQYYTFDNQSNGIFTPKSDYSRLWYSMNIFKYNVYFQII